MTNTLNRLAQLTKQQQQHCLRGGLKGIEKESLRIGANGFVSQRNHPAALGSALTHPYITTDYSEALIELITPPFAQLSETLAYLQNLHTFVYENLQDELLLCASMPCGIDGDASIRIAEYGSSNIGRMKHIYRHGLWHRYGRTMQAIAGIHFNYSVPEALWTALHSLENSPLSLQEFTNQGYFALIRNFQRCGWLVLYLFGASPALCKNFFSSRPQLMAQFEEFDNGTLYLPYATSLRMSDIGYKSKNQANLNIDYNTLDAYVNDLAAACATPYPEYQAIGVEVNGEYRQLNSNVLQIENEFYSIIRPKQIINSGEKPTLALKRRGVRYIEMRSLDLNPFLPLGIDENTAYFVEALLLSCLLTDSPPMSAQEHQTNNTNQLAVADFGRQADLTLTRDGQTLTLRDWANDILQTMRPVCEILDGDSTDKPYSTALNHQQAAVNNPDLTPSARLLAVLREHHQPFARYALNASAHHAQHFQQIPLSDAQRLAFSEQARLSHDKQRELENKVQPPFAQFLHDYFAQQF